MHSISFQLTEDNIQTWFLHGLLWLAEDKTIIIIFSLGRTHILISNDAVKIAK